MKLDTYAVKMRILEALDRGDAISFDDLRRRVNNGGLKELIDNAGTFPNLSMPDADWDEITAAITSVLMGNVGDEFEHFYVKKK